MDINKIRIGEGKLTIDYRNKVGETTQDTEITSTERALPSFYDTINLLCPHVVKMCELPDGWKENISIVSVTFKRDDDLFGVTITAAKTIRASNSPFLIHTPFATEKSPESEASGIPAAMLRTLRQLEKEAEKFVQGHRAQGKLDFVQGGTG